MDRKAYDTYFRFSLPFVSVSVYVRGRCRNRCLSLSSGATAPPHGNAAPCYALISFHEKNSWQRKTNNRQRNKSDAAPPPSRHNPHLTPPTNLKKVLGEMGIVFFLFEMGLELSVSRLMAMKRDVFGLGLATFGVSAAAVAGVCFLAGLTGAQMVVIGGGVALSSSAFVLQLLRDRDDLGTRYGRACFGILLFQVGWRGVGEGFVGYVQENEKYCCGGRP